MGEVAQGLDACVVEGEELQVCEFLEELLVVLGQVLNFQLIEDKVGELLYIHYSVTAINKACRPRTLLIMARIRDKLPPLDLPQRG